MTVVTLERRKQSRERLKTVFSLRESQIQRAILDLLAAEHIFAIRFNTGAFRDVRGIPINTHSGGKGLADILAFPRVAIRNWAPSPLWIEVKRPGKEQTPEQKSFQSLVEAEGHFYFVAHSTDEVLAWLKTRGAHYAGSKK